MSGHGSVPFSLSVKVFLYVAVHGGFQEDERASTKFAVPFVRRDEIICVVTNVELTQRRSTVAKDRSSVVWKRRWIAGHTRPPPPEDSLITQESVNR